MITMQFLCSNFRTSLRLGKAHKARHMSGGGGAGHFFAMPQTRLKAIIREFQAKGNPSTFPLTFHLPLREKLREFPSQILFGLRELSQTESAFPLGTFARE